MKKILQTASIIFLISIQLSAQTDSCNLLTDKRSDIGWLKSTRRIPVVQTNNRVFGVFLENYYGTYKMIIDWAFDIKLVKTKFDTGKKNVIYFALEDGRTIKFAINESSPGRGGMKSSWGSYELGGIIVIPPDDVTALSASPIKEVYFSFYGLPADTIRDLKATNVFVKGFPCIK